MTKTQALNSQYDSLVQVSWVDTVSFTIATRNGQVQLTQILNEIKIDPQDPNLVTQIKRSRNKPIQFLLKCSKTDFQISVFCELSQHSITAN